MGFDSSREKGSVDYLDVDEDGGLDEEALIAARLSSTVSPASCTELSRR